MKKPYHNKKINASLFSKKNKFLQKIPPSGGLPRL
jgi:hypothetical protein